MRIVKKSILFILCVVASSCSTNNSKYILYEVTKLHQKIYILGVMHVLPNKYAQIPASVNKAYQKSGVLFVESLIGKNEKRSFRYSPVVIPTSADAEYIEAQINQLDKDGLILESEKANIRNASAASLQSEFTQIIYRRVLKSRNLDYLSHSGNTNGLDQMLVDRADIEKKNVRSLEPAGSHRNVPQSNCSSYDRYLQSLNGLMKATYSDDYIIKVNLLIKLLFDGRLEEFTNTLNQLAESYGHVKLEMECSNVPRTIAWAKNWETLFKETEISLVVVGAAHLTVKPTLTELLAEQGYQINRVID